MRTAITGATGFIGGHMARGLAAAGHTPRLLCRPGREAALPPRGPGFDYEVHVGDLLDPGSLEGFLEGCELLVHLAGLHGNHDQESMQQVNIRGTEYLLAEATRCAGEGFRFFVVSSAVIGAPVYSYYRDSKRVQEKIIRGSGLEWTSFRPTLVYGTGDFRHTAPLLRRCAAKGTMWVPHSGLSKINPVHVDDIVAAVRLFLEKGGGVDCVYELAGPAGISYNDFIDFTVRAVDGRMKRRNIAKKWADRLIFLKGLFTDTTEHRRASAYFTMHHAHDISNAVGELGWTPRPYETGIAEVARGDWWRE